MPAAEELIAYQRTPEEVAKEIGADWMIYQDLEDLEKAVRKRNAALERFDSSVFTGEYVTGDVDEAYLEAIGAKRSDDAKNKRDGKGEASVIDLHNSA